MWVAIVLVVAVVTVVVVIIIISKSTIKYGLNFQIFLLELFINGVTSRFSFGLTALHTFHNSS